MTVVEQLGPDARTPVHHRDSERVQHRERRHLMPGFDLKMPELDVRRRARLGLETLLVQYDEDVRVIGGEDHACKLLGGIVVRREGIREKLGFVLVAALDAECESLWAGPPASCSRRGLWSCAGPPRRMSVPSVYVRVRD